MFDKKLTYSELIYYFGSEFIPSASFLENKEELLDGQKVSVKRLAEYMVLGSLVYLIENKYLELFNKETSKFGIFKGSSIFLRRISPAPIDLGGIEAKIYSYVKNEADLGKSIYYLLDQDVFLPWSDIVRFSKDSLVHKGILEAETTKKLIFMTTKYRKTQDYSQVLLIPLEGLKKAMQIFQNSYPNYKELLKIISVSISQRQEQSDSDD